MNTIGSIEVTIRIRLNADVTLEEARKFIEEMDYEIKDTTGKLSICETEVVSDNVDVEEADVLILRSRCASARVRRRRPSVRTPRRLAG